MSSGVIYDSPFGSLISTRSWSDASRAYRYGFNGKEKDFETANDNFPIAIGIGARIYDGRLGRWLSPDPEYKIYINLALYQFTNNNPNYYKEINVEVFDLSNIEDIDAYNAQIELMKSRSPLFRYVYDRLENSETVYVSSPEKSTF